MQGISTQPNCSYSLQYVCLTLFSDFKKATCLKIPRGKQTLLTGGNPSTIMSFLLLTVLHDDVKFSQWNKTTFSLISVETWRKALLSCRSSETKIGWCLCTNSVIISVLPMSLAYRSTFWSRHKDWCTARPVGNAAAGTFHRQKSVGFCLAHSNAEPIHRFTEEFLLELKISVLSAAKCISFHCVLFSLKALE